MSPLTGAAVQLLSNGLSGLFSGNRCTPGLSRHEQREVFSAHLDQLLEPEKTGFKNSLDSRAIRHLSALELFQQQLKTSILGHGELMRFASGIGGFAGKFEIERHDEGFTLHGPNGVKAHIPPDTLLESWVSDLYLSTSVLEFAELHPGVDFGQMVAMALESTHNESSDNTRRVQIV